MDLPLCVLLSVIILCFILLVVVSGIRFKFHIGRETFQGQQQQQQKPSQELANLIQVPDENVQMVRNIEETPKEDRLSLFHHSQCKPECCSNGRGTHSCSTGCVCVSDEDLNLITRRGGNHSAPCL
tara:strand:- start:2931 stop:3308 length:378 start_codon:yes stop_codon:yes gene_type:complete